MPKLANPQSETLHIQLKAKPEWEVHLRAFREICSRNGLSMSEELYNRGVLAFLQAHNWPPGNSQTLLFPKPKKKCHFCKTKEAKARVTYLSGLVADTCPGCKEKNKLTVKKVNPIC